MKTRRTGCVNAMLGIVTDAAGAVHWNLVKRAFAQYEGDCAQSALSFAEREGAIA
jgi:hypothetical protein